MIRLHYRTNRPTVYGKATNLSRNPLIRCNPNSVAKREAFQLEYRTDRRIASRVVQQSVMAGLEATVSTKRDVQTV
jgi:hypothetical protein